jgi:hypothetical protein
MQLRHRGVSDRWRIRESLTERSKEASMSPGAPPAIAWGLSPVYEARSKIPLLALLRSFIAGGFSAARMEKALADLINRQPDLADFIDVEAPRSGGPLARPELLFEQPSSWTLMLYGGKGEEFKPTKGWKIGEDRLAGGAWRQIIDCAHISDPPAIQPDTSALTPGTFLRRREHASIEVASSGRTRIVFDPVFRGTETGTHTEALGHRLWGFPARAATRSSLRGLPAGR